MKKLLFLIVVLFAFLFIAELTSCFINDSEDARLIRPAVSDVSGAISISCNYLKGTKYINVFRRKSDNPAMDNASAPENIGQIIPAKDIKELGSFNFTDLETHGETYYTYFIRYYNGSYYTYTRESEIKKGKGTKELLVDPETNTLDFLGDYSEKNFTLTLKDAVNTPNDEYELDVIVDNGTTAQPFKIKQANDSNVIPANTKIDLQRVLTSSYYDKPLKIKGLIIMKYYDIYESKDATTYYWSNLAPVTVKGTIIDEDNNPDIEDEVVEEITVPTPGDTDNEFDYTEIPEKYRSALPSTQSVNKKIPLDLYNPFI